MQFLRVNLKKKISSNQRTLRIFIYIFFLLLLLHQHPTYDQGTVWTSKLLPPSALQTCKADFKDVPPRHLSYLPVPLLETVLHREGPAPAGHAQVLMKGSLFSGKHSAFQKEKSYERCKRHHDQRSRRHKV